MKKHLLTSIVLHATLLGLVIVFSIKWWNKYSHNNKVEVYLSHSQSTEANKWSTPTPTTQVSKSPEPNRSSGLRPRMTCLTPAHTNLTSLLHTLIQNQIQQQTNHLAKFGKRKLQLSFTLFPDGHIENTHILQSSGINFFDKTAIEGVAALPKIPQAQELKTPENFTVWIEFV